MFSHKLTNFSSLLWLPLLLILLSNAENFYIVFLGDHPLIRDNAHEAHLNVLSTVKESHIEAKESLVYSYTKILNFNAFVIKCLAKDEVLSLFPNRYHKLHTTRSWDFIGLPLTAKRKLQSESDTIVGLLDTGVTPEFQSFKDNGLGPPPAKWKGTCDHFTNFSGCNNKLIGARYFKLDKMEDPEDILSPIDVNGHGTHTSSTAAGSLVPKASLLGLAEGTARGAVPSARLAIYKVCWQSSGCADMDLLAAFEAAIHDGVDVISISIGGGDTNYLKDSIAIGAFHAMRNGIITVASAGNDGPAMGTVTNTAPWIVTVAASGIDREFKSTIELGNGKNVSEHFKCIDSFCFEDSLDPKKVKGKIVYCKQGTGGTEGVIKGYGGIGTILENEQFPEVAQIFMAPATIVNTTIGQSITTYIKSTRSPSAVILKSHEVKRPAPFTASFSSRGPNPGSKNILKPDIAAPGVNILASYTLRKSITGLKGDTQFSEFTLMSGTSMSCPHVAGVAAYVKSFHPDWTPAAIRSAIITTAKPMSKRVDKEAEFAFGAGQINPTKAVNPGLVYDMDDLGYIQFLCHEGYNGSNLSVLVGHSINCTSLVPGHGHDAINYPTIQFNVKKDKETTLGVFRRRVTNVGPVPTSFNATITAPKGVEITVKPSSLVFSKAMQQRSFKVVVKAKTMASMKVVSGSLVWRSPRYIVRSPIALVASSGSYLRFNAKSVLASFTSHSILQCSCAKGNMKGNMTSRTLLLFLALMVTNSIAIMDKQTYIVHMDKTKIKSSIHSQDSTKPWFQSVIDFITEVSVQEDEEEIAPQLLYVYETNMFGFSAHLSSKQLEYLNQVDGFLAAMPDELLTLHTTHTPHFLGLQNGRGLWSAPSLASDVIVGILDTGIWPEHISFQDTGLTEVPSRWKGSCEEGTKFSASNCNKKLIGARAFYKGYEKVIGRINETLDYRSPRDSQGHGTHTASTAAGNMVNNASLFGMAKGSASGMRYTSKVAAYKVCWPLGCANSDILAAMDQAVADGVDILSLSLGGIAKPYYNDSIAIASFGATQNGVFVSCSAGNSGPFRSTVGNVAPWIITVAASYTDRSFPTKVKLGNGQVFKGASLYHGKTIQLPLVHANTTGTQRTAQFCTKGSLDPKLVHGKIVACERGMNSRTEKGEVVKMAGGAGMLLLVNQGEELFADSHILPATSLGASASNAIRNYIHSAKSPTASISFIGTIVTYKRVVTNVGYPSSSYTVKVEEPNGVSVKVEPRNLRFGKLGEKLNYSVTFVANGGTTISDTSTFGSLTWVSGKYNVRSPIAITWQ
ncbi:hypothetical protein Ahy_A02g006141 [Arachis hypogaea]|uniref:Subtilisin-like protease n=1 Tax=Arachis hypogaea TaxID=3818 RepID=A0A445E8Y6_ARAHY|nr:hypothetical protein Ahy_A02g006141 [Arachis hypogaea]